MAILKYRGLCAAVFTAFKNDMSVNYEVIPKYAKFLADNGVDGVLVHGTTGEGMVMSVPERKSVIEEWAKAVKSTKQHLMIQVGGCPLPDTVELAKHAENIGVGSLLCLPELYYKPSTIKQLINYLKVVGEAAPETPLVYYHNPAMSGVNLNMAQFIKEAAKELPTFQGIKYTSHDLDGGVAALKAADGMKCAVFLGVQKLFATAAILGFDSIIASTLNVLPELAGKILKAVNEGEIVEAQKLQKSMSEICTAISKDGAWIPSMKIAMNMLTPINVGKARPPIENLTEDQVIEMKKSLQSMSVLKS